MANKGSVTRNIVNYISKNIQDGTYKIGEAIPSENKFCELLGVSRVSVRNALKQLIALNILESVHGKGTYVVSDDLKAFNPPEDSVPMVDLSLDSVSNMENLLRFRCMIEPSICMEATKNATPELIENLNRELECMRKNVGNAREYVESDIRFHMELCKVCNNPLLTDVMEKLFMIKSESSDMLNFSNGFYGGIYYHGIILDAIIKGDEKKARKFMYEHLLHGIADLST